MHLLFVGHLQDEGWIRWPLSLMIVELEKGHLEKLFLKESKEQGEHFDASESVSKIVSSSLKHFFCVNLFFSLTLSRLIPFRRINCLSKIWMVIRTSTNSFIGNLLLKQDFLKNQRILVGLPLQQIVAPLSSQFRKLRHTGSRSALTLF